MKNWTGKVIPHAEWHRIVINDLSGFFTTSQSELRQFKFYSEELFKMTDPSYIYNGEEYKFNSIQADLLSLTELLIVKN